MKLGFTKGDVIFGRKNSDAIHPILFLEDRDNTYFIGVMLTHAADYGNIALEKKHILEEDEQGRKFPFQFNNTHFVKARLLKKNEWMPFRKIGKMSTEGVSVVEANINLNQEVLWEDFIQGN